MKILIWLRSLFNSDVVWEYGVCNKQQARRHRLHGNVQFLLWYAGEHGHLKDYWINFDSSWWPEFKPDKV